MKVLLSVFAVVALMALFVFAEEEEVKPRIFQGFDSDTKTPCNVTECFETCRKQSAIIGVCIEGVCRCLRW
ncbi:unnamed protein product [Acanthoscelides obtectus]|uniref:Uncharacterized protein n=1 Tax=Acanthoscelides obtectus TaxID=200917 RepID=A0A9P0PWF6_ACAOB|nr:unnamed protein product [Acanthoscelides obtectus]CAH2000922.1 unnamed protein product [Acanthoscelides obtectus]CAH2011694.1 unnamed protein product [Acanthoscelides obtectus]CAK1675325.1 hypothetical protein AOBTE_LOCUS30138 [Acanthoscelides obtectus]CAK1675404.1 hypothetical protein AOBTE_LOCUS30205 [Acanthoscelides obtectus]